MCVASLGTRLTPSTGCDIHGQRFRRLVRHKTIDFVISDAQSDLSRVMRKTGKLYGLTLASCGLTIVAAVFVVMWNENSSPFHLWFDIAPQGLGMASVITTTLIVCVNLRSYMLLFSRMLLVS